MSAVEERVVIKVEVNTDVAKAHAQLETFFRMLDANSKHTNRSLDKTDKELKKIDKTTNKVTKSNGKLEKSNNKVTKSFVRLKKTLKTAGGVLSNFLSKFSLFSFIGVAVEIALISTALLSVKLALVSGRLAMQAYQLTLTGLGVAAGGVAVVLGSVAAAMRQLNEATLAPDIGGYKQAAQAMRSVMSDSQLSFFGMEGLQSSVNALSRGGVSTDRSYTKILKSLGNYTSDPKQLADLATVYADITKTGSISSDSLGKLGDINPALTGGITELTGLSGDDLEAVLGEDGAGIGSDVFEALLSGQAEFTNAWEGQLARMNNTVIGTLKGMLPRMFTLFADLGSPFLDTIQQTLTSIEGIVTKTVMRIRGSVTGFGLDSFMPGLLKGFELLSDWIARLVNESLPKIDGFFDSMMGTWDTVKNYFIDMVRIFEPLEAGADVLLRVLGPQFGGMFDGFAALIKNFSKSLVDNEETFQSFGNAIGRFIEGFLRFFDNANDRFVEAIPVWVNLIDTLTQDVLPALQDVFNMLHKASITVLPVVTAALSVVADVLGSVAVSLTAIMNIPGIGQLLGVAVGGMMFKTTRAPIMAAGRATGLLSKPAVAGGAAATTGLLARGLSAQVALPGAAATLASRNRVAALTGGKIIGPAAGTTMSAGSLLATGAVSSVAGYGAGRFAGDQIGGAGGVAAGGALGTVAGGVGGAVTAGILAGGSVTSWSGPGALLGMGVGAALGLGFGLYGAKRSHDIESGALEAATKIVEEFYDGLESSLSKGQGREAIYAAQFEMEDMLKNVADMAEELGVDQIALTNDLLSAQKKLDTVAAESLATLDNRVGFLSETTGIASAKIEELANVAGIDLTNGAERALIQLQQIGAITYADLSLGGIEDSSNNVLWESLFGAGSAYEKDFIAPEQRDTLNAYLNEAKDVVDSGGSLDSEMYRKIIEQVIAIDQTQYGMEGTDLYEGLAIDFERLDELFGVDGMFSRSLPDIQRAREERLDPTKNKSLMALKAAIFDQVNTDVDWVGATESGRADETERRYQSEMETLMGAVEIGGWGEFDNLLAGMLEDIGNDEQYENMVMFGDAVVRATERLDELLGGGPDDPHNQRDIPSVQSHVPSGFGGGSPGTGDPSQTINTSKTINQRLASETTVNMDVSGLGMQEALALIRDAAEKAARNISQRRNSIFTGNIKK